MARVLICDDSPTILKLVEKRLTDAGHQVVARAKDGVEGFDQYQATLPELMLLDITMPNRDGRECLAAILEKHPGARVIMVSALTDQKVVDECIAMGAKGFVHKTNLYKDEDFQREVLPLLNGVMKAS